MHLIDTPHGRGFMKEQAARPGKRTTAGGEKATIAPLTLIKKPGDLSHFFEFLAVVEKLAPHPRDRRRVHRPAGARCEERELGAKAADHAAARRTSSSTASGTRSSRCCTTRVGRCRMRCRSAVTKPRRMLIRNGALAGTLQAPISSTVTAANVTRAAQRAV